MNASKISPTIGILGGGQLGKMLAQAGADWNLDISVLDPTPDSPASCCAKQILGNFRDYEAVLEFGRDKDLITIEIEDVNLDALRVLKGRGKKVYPDPDAVALIQDKGLQKEFYSRHGFPTSEFILAANATEILQLEEAGKLKIPFVQKLTKAGYDGRGVQIVNEITDLDNLFDAPSVIESLVNIKKEIAVLAARNVSGEIITYDPVEMIFHPTANLLLYQECPAELDDTINTKAKSIAHELISKLNIVGLLAVELFINQHDEILINEVAPRPHNSGHHTIEACSTSQFHQHWRAVLDLPLGSADTLHHSILLNVLGESGYSGDAIYSGIDKCLALPGVYIHLYGKKQTKPFRKMGHVTIIGKDIDQVRDIAKEVSKTLKVIA